MRLDEHWRIDWSPSEFFKLATDEPRRLINQFLLRATPHAFPNYRAYYEFLEDVASRFNVPPQNIVLRGSCLIGFSITPHKDNLWQECDDSSDLDLALVDPVIYDETENHVGRWERLNRAGEVQGKASERFIGRQQDRFYHCCRLDALPDHLSGHYRDAVKAIAVRAHSGPGREVNIFLYHDWWAIRARYEFDLGKLKDGVRNGSLPPPEDRALPRLRP